MPKAGVNGTEGLFICMVNASVSMLVRQAATERKWAYIGCSLRISKVIES